MDNPQGELYSVARSGGWTSLLEGCSLSKTSALTLLSAAHTQHEAVFSGEILPMEAAACFLSPSLPPSPRPKALFALLEQMQEFPSHGLQVTCSPAPSESNPDLSPRQQLRNWNAFTGTPLSSESTSFGETSRHPLPATPPGCAAMGMAEHGLTLQLCSACRFGCLAQDHSPGGWCRGAAAAPRGLWGANGEGDVTPGLIYFFGGGSVLLCCWTLSLSTAGGAFSMQMHFVSCFLMFYFS